MISSLSIFSFTCWILIISSYHPLSCQVTNFVELRKTKLLSPPPGLLNHDMYFNNFRGVSYMAQLGSPATTSSFSWTHLWWQVLHRERVIPAQNAFLFLCFQQFSLSLPGLPELLKCISFAPELPCQNLKMALVASQIFPSPAWCPLYPWAW